MSSSTRRPTATALRHALHRALQVNPWSVFYATRCLRALDTQPPHSALAMMLLGVLAHQPHWETDKVRCRDAREARQRERIASFAAFTVQPHTIVARGGLPLPLQPLQAIGCTLSRAFDLILETAWLPGVLRFFQQPDGVVKHDALIIGIHKNRATIEINTAAGAHWSATWSAADDWASPPAAVLALRVSLHAGAIIELGRLTCGGDETAADRAAFFGAHSHESLTAPLIDTTPAAAPRPSSRRRRHPNAS